MVLSSCITHSEAQQMLEGTLPQGLQGCGLENSRLEEQQRCPSGSVSVGGSIAGCCKEQVSEFGNWCLAVGLRHAKSHPKQDARVFETMSGSQCMRTNKKDPYKPCCRGRAWAARTRQYTEGSHLCLCLQLSCHGSCEFGLLLLLLKLGLLCSLEASLRWLQLQILLRIRHHLWILHSHPDHFRPMTPGQLSLRQEGRASPGNLAQSPDFA